MSTDLAPGTQGTPTPGAPTLDSAVAAPSTQALATPEPTLSVQADPSPSGTRNPATARAGALRRLSPGLLLAAVLAALYLLAAVAPGLLATHGASELNLSAALTPPGWAHPFGTDEVGRDLYSRVVYGTRTSLLIGAGAAAVSLSLAVVLGTLAALGPRALAAVVNRVVEVQFAFPTLLLALLLVAITGPSAVAQVFAVAIGTTPGYARMIRGQLLGVRGSGYVEAATLLGHGRGRILLRQVLPNALRPLVAVFALCVGQSIVWASSLAFLGLGVAPPSPEWGALLDAGRAYVVHAPWLTLIPGLVIVVLAVVATTLGRHLQAALDHEEH